MHRYICLNRAQYYYLNIYFRMSVNANTNAERISILKTIEIYCVFQIIYIDIVSTPHC